MDTMGDLPSPTSSGRPRRDTGFPPSFDGVRNTTLPHPDADTSGNASIGADDLDVQRTVSGQRRTSKYRSKRTLSHGVITPEMERTYSELVLAHAQSPDTEDLTVISSKRSQLSIRGSKDGNASFVSSNGTELHTDGEPSPGSSPTLGKDYVRSSQGSGLPPNRRKSLFKRLIHR
jgi:hypothetical protein